MLFVTRDWRSKPRHPLHALLPGPMLMRDARRECNPSRPKIGTAAARTQDLAQTCGSRRSGFTCRCRRRMLFFGGGTQSQRPRSCPQRPLRPERRHAERVRLSNVQRTIPRQERDPLPGAPVVYPGRGRASPYVDYRKVSPPLSRVVGGAERSRP